MNTKYHVFVHFLMFFLFLDLCMCWGGGGQQLISCNKREMALMIILLNIYWDIHSHFLIG